MALERTKTVLEIAKLGAEIYWWITDARRRARDDKAEREKAGEEREARVRELEEENDRLRQVHGGVEP